MTLSPPLLRRPGLWLVLLLSAVAVAATVGGFFASDSRADPNPSNLDCRGHLEAGEPDPADEDTQVKYVFACNGKITGYQIQPQIGNTGFESGAVVIGRDGNAITTDSFSCAGDFPGFGVNCTGVYSGNYANVSARFSIAGKLCDEPRVDALLTVVYATADAKGVVTQYISGPYDLGRPRGCPKSQFGGKTRIPADDDATIGGDEPAAATKPKTATKPKAKKKAKAKSKSARSTRR